MAVAILLFMLSVNVNYPKIHIISKISKVSSTQTNSFIKSLITIPEKNKYPLTLITLPAVESFLLCSNKALLFPLKNFSKTNYKHYWK